MVLATTALLLLLAIPTSSLSAVFAESAEATAVASEPASPQPETTTTEAILVASSEATNDLLGDPEPGPNVTYAPGRLVPERLLSATPVESSSMNPPAVAIVLSSEAVDQRQRWEQRQKKIWLGLSIISSGAATFDAWSTRRVISSGKGQEVNPLLRPFARNDSLYAAIQVGPLLLDYLGRRMLTSEHGWMRRTWWIPQALGTAVSVASGVNNLRVH